MFWMIPGHSETRSQKDVDFWLLCIGQWHCHRNTLNHVESFESIDVFAAEL